MVFLEDTKALGVIGGILIVILILVVLGVIGLSFN